MPIFLKIRESQVGSSYNINGILHISSGLEDPAGISHVPLDICLGFEKYTPAHLTETRFFKPELGLRYKKCIIKLLGI
jgi:hypothetical protein